MPGLAYPCSKSVPIEACFTRYISGIVDSDVDPVNLTYVIPGNDDSAASILFFHKTFATAIQRGKATKELLKVPLLFFLVEQYNGQNQDR